MQATTGSPFAKEGLLTSSDLRKRSPTELEALYASKRADRLPVGAFDGVSWPLSTYGLWGGKVFDPPNEFGFARVRNRILGGLHVQGTVFREDDAVVILYAQLGGLKDYLKPVQADLWLGRMALPLSRTVWFSLTKTKDI